MVAALLRLGGRAVSLLFVVCVGFPVDLILIPYPGSDSPCIGESDFFSI